MADVRDRELFRGGSGGPGEKECQAVLGLMGMERGHLKGSHQVLVPSGLNKYL